MPFKTGDKQSLLAGRSPILTVEDHTNLLAMDLSGMKMSALAYEFCVEIGTIRRYLRRPVSWTEEEFAKRHRARLERQGTAALGEQGTR